ncbi:MAG TPA: PadR family transcriptional regulator [Mycobacteriales bacterium]|nr:PadR family transcriptional regulator [Mycobacteriales bacterium]
MTSRFFRHGELPLVLLALLAERPRHGYELMAELARRFGPRYRASPGSIYPALEALETEGLIEEERARGTSKTVYRNTDAGIQALAARGELLAELEIRTGVRLAGEDSLGALLDRFKARLLPLAGIVDPVAAAGVLDQAATRIERLQRSATRRQK